MRKSVIIRLILETTSISIQFYDANLRAALQPEKKTAHDTSTAIGCHVPKIGLFLTTVELLYEIYRG